jgi:hypothetical protein
MINEGKSIEDAVLYVKESVPQSVKKFNKTDEQLAKMIKARM